MLARILDVTPATFASPLPGAATCARRRPIFSRPSNSNRANSWPKAASSSIRMMGGAQQEVTGVEVEFLGCNIQPMGLGLASLGRPGYINLGHGEDFDSRSQDEMRQQCWRVLDSAWGQGIRAFDCARSYGMSEQFLSSWIEARGIAPEDVCVSSKWGYRYTADWRVDTQGEPHEVKEHSISNLLKQTSETEALLGRHLNLYQIHSATFESGVLDNAEVLGQLGSLKTEHGWRIGLTLSGTQQAEVLKKALAVKTPSGDLLFDCVQATWNLLEQSAGPALLEARQAGLDVLIKEAMANGRLTPRNTFPGFAPKLALLEAFATKNSTTVDAVALACVIKQGFRPVVLSGASTAEQLESNAKALALAARIGTAEVSELSQAMVQPPDEYWAERSTLAWN